MTAIKPQDDGNVVLFQQEEFARAVQLLEEESLTFGKVYRSHKGEAQEFLMLDELKWLSSEGGIDISGQHVAYMADDSVPVAAMLLAQHSGCSVTVIDPVPETASLAQEIIRRVGLSHLVKVLRQPADEVDYSAYTLIWASGNVRARKSAFNRVLEFTNVQYVIIRAELPQNQNFVVNEIVDECKACDCGFKIMHQAPQRLASNLVSVVMYHAPCHPTVEKSAIEPVRRRVVDSMVDLVGNTPMLRLDPEKTGLKNIELYAKLEHLNPFGSIKDRTAKAMLAPHIRDIAEQNREILELSSGNAARGLQAIAAIHGTRLETVSNRIRIPEMRKILELQGAKITPIDDKGGTLDALGALKTVDEKATRESDRYFYTDQYRNPANDGTHCATTGREIIEDVGPVDFMIGSVGTAGSTMGLARALRQANENIEVIGVVSDGVDYIPGIRFKGEIFNVGSFDEKSYRAIQDVSVDEAIDGVIDLMRLYGVMAGPSSGATYHAALKHLRAVDATLTAPKKAVFVVCDRVELYLSWLQSRRPELFSA